MSSSVFLLVFSFCSIYLILMNLLAIFITIYDKKIAGSNKRRISERFLLSIAFFGGALGMYIIMKKIRHKTKHKNFMILLPIFIFLQILILAIFIIKHFFIYYN